MSTTMRVRSRPAPPAGTYTVTVTATTELASRSRRTRWSWTATPRAPAPVLALRSGDSSAPAWTRSGLGRGIGHGGHHRPLRGPLARRRHPRQPHGGLRRDAPGGPHDEARAHLRPPPPRPGRRRQLEPMGGERGLRPGAVAGHQPDPRPIGWLDPLLPVMDVGWHSALLATRGASITRSFTGRAIALVRPEEPGARQGEDLHRRRAARRRWTLPPALASIGRSCSPAPGRRPAPTPSRCVVLGTRPAARGRGRLRHRSVGCRARGRPAARGALAAEW